MTNPSRFGALLVLLLAASCAGPSSTLPAPGAHSSAERSAASPGGAGLLIMAHGGSPEWNAAVGDAVAPLRGRLPTALALGMADPATLRSSLDSLRARGVQRVAVVRLFMSGASFRHQTEYLLGLRDDPPAEPLLHHGRGGHGGLLPLSHGMEIALSTQGLGESEVGGEILVDRARRLSRDAARESVILVAHGMGDEEENDQVLDYMRRTTEALGRMGFRGVHAATLREDWPEARVRAEKEIRGWVAQSSARGERTLVVPYRLSGFGPYAEVLGGLDYTPAEGLLPHPLVTRWIEEEALRLLCTEGGAEGASCRARVTGVELGARVRVPS
ncbi:MAG: hypothetical protein Q8N53_02760 [Longimicrobiales bacterium]|nr:hypothetical protein [Longimicrobiales bacterium]